MFTFKLSIKKIIPQKLGRMRELTVVLLILAGLSAVASAVSIKQKNIYS